MNLGAVAGLSRRTLGGVWYRAIAPQRLSSPLYAAGSRDKPSRYNPGPSATHGVFSTFYLAEDHVLCLHEVGAVFGVPAGVVPNPIGTWCILNVGFGLGAVADLTDEGSRDALAVSLEELTGAWRFSPRGNAPTQILAGALFRTPDIEGVIYPSARTGGRNLVLFPDKLTATSWVEYVDSRGALHTLP